MKNRNVAVCLPLAIFSAASLAGLSQSTAPNPGGFGQAGAFSATTGPLFPGTDLETAIGVPEDFQEVVPLLGGNGWVTASFTDGTVSNNMLAKFGYGYMRARGSNTSPDAAPLAAAVANGGWQDKFLITNSRLNGQGGHFAFLIRGLGTLETTGQTGAARLHVVAYKNNVPVVMNSYYDRIDSDVISSPYQYAAWGLSSSGAPESRTFSGMTLFAVPFVFGEEFTLGVFGAFVVGQGNAEGIGASTAEGNVEMGWDRYATIYADCCGPAPFQTYITTASGKEWGHAVFDCPADLNGDGIVDDGDFPLFVSAYDMFDCLDPAMQLGCPADINGDGVVDDADFSLFAMAYNALLCT